MKRFLFCFVTILIALPLLSQSGVAPSGLGTEASPYLIATWQNLYWVSQNSSEWGKHFLQTADIDFSTATPAITTWNGNQGWTPIGNATTQFTGVYDGDGFKVMNLYLNYPGSGEPTSVIEAQALPGNIGLFGYLKCTSTTDAIIRNLGILNADVTGGRGTGTLLGRSLLPSDASHTTIVENCYAAGNVTVRGFGATGGLVGANNSQKKNIVPIIRYCYADADVESRFPTNSIQNPADNNELFNIKYGGLVGCNENGLTMDSYSRGNVYGGKRVGGVSGCSIRGAVIRCYATGQVRTGFQSPPFTADADPFVGGIVGRVDGKLPGGLGGFSGSGSIQMCYWDTTTSGNTTSGGGSGAQGRTTAQMQTQANYTDWNFNGVWLISASQYPRLGWQDDVNINPTSDTYEGMLSPTVDTGTALPNALYSSTSVGGQSVYTGFMPSATETVNISIYAIYSENPLFVEGDFPNPENLGAYWKFYCSDDAVLRNAQYFDIQMPNEYTDIWYRYSRDGAEVLSWRKIPGGVSVYQSGSYIYRITISGLSLPSGARAGELGEIEFAGDIGGGETLPVELSSFTATQTSVNAATLAWTTQSESDMIGYYVLRSQTEDLVDATRISGLIAAGNSPAENSYHYTDEDVSCDNTYRYWLQSVAMDATSAFFGPVTLTITNNEGEGNEAPEVFAIELMGCYPNPFNPATTISYSLAKDGLAKFTIFDLKGREVDRFSHDGAKGYNKVTWNAENMASGIYFVRMNAQGTEQTRKVMLLK